MFGYLCNNKSRKIAKNIVTYTYNKGGLKMIDIKRIMHWKYHGLEESTKIENIAFVLFWMNTLKHL